MSTRSKKGILSSLVLLILYTTFQKTVVQGRGATKSATFEKLSASSGVSLQVLTSYTDVSRLSCASLCLSSVKRRGYFTHNDAQQTCACGVTLVASPLPSGVSLYAPKCDHPGYQLYVLRPTRVCVKLGERSANYETARDDCWRDGEAYLYMHDTGDKKELIQQIRGTFDSVWLGLDDLEEEGVWRYNDGRLAHGYSNHGSQELQNIFDCLKFKGIVAVYYYMVSCSQIINYICEMPIE